MPGQPDSANDFHQLQFHAARRQGVESTQDPIERFGSVDASFRGPSGNGWKMVEARR